MPFNHRPATQESQRSKGISFWWGRDEVGVKGIKRYRLSRDSQPEQNHLLEWGETRELLVQ
jgi:hypothetical protein